MSLVVVKDDSLAAHKTDGFLLQHATNAITYVWNYENAATVFGTNSTESTHDCVHRLFLSVHWTSTLSESADIGRPS